MPTDPNLHLLSTWLSRNGNVSEVLRESARDILHPFTSLFVLVGAVGIISNIVLFVLIVRRRLYTQSIFQLVANLAVVEVVRCFLVLPLLLITIFVKGWRLGSFLCFVWPVLLPCTLHVSLFGHLALFVFRYLKVVHNMKSPIPAWTCIVTSWLLSIAIQTPHAAFKRYIDVQPLLGTRYRGVGICVLRPGAIERNKEYVLSVFLVFFIGVLVIVFTLALLIHGRIKRREREFHPESTSCSMEMNIRVEEREEYDEDNLKYPDSAMLENDDLKFESPVKLKSDLESSVMKLPCEQTLSEQPVIAKKTKLKDDRKMQRFLLLLTVLFALLWLPYYIHYQIEAFMGTEEPSDIVAYLLLLLVGYVSSWSLPFAFSLWQMSKDTKQKISSTINPKKWNRRV